MMSRKGIFSISQVGKVKRGQISKSLLVTVIYIIFGISLCLHITSAEKGKSKLKSSKNEEKLPKFSFGEQEHLWTCRLDSPEQFYNSVALSSIQFMHDETKVFFAVLMEKLESTVRESDKETIKKLDEQWTYLIDAISKNFDLGVKRINYFWNQIIAHTEIPLMPWEGTTQKLVMEELFQKLVHEYRMFEAVGKAGIREIVSTLQVQLVQVLQQLERKGTSSSQDKTREMQFQKLEQHLKKLDKNFVTDLLMKVVKKALDKNSQHPISTFLTPYIEQVYIMSKAFSNKGHQASFWSQMSSIYTGELAFPRKEVTELLRLYQANEDLIVSNVLSFISKQ